MSDLATSYVEDVINSFKEHARIPITEHEGRLILFWVYHLNGMTSDLRERFYRLLDDDRAH